MTMFKRGAALVVALAMTFVCTARAQVLQQVPADALVVFKVNNLKATSDKIAKLSLDLGLAAMVPPMADPLGAMQVQMKMQQGINVNGELAVVLMDPTVQGRSEPVIILIPVTDYRAFLSNWPGAQTTGPVTQITIPDEPAPAFIANWGQYAALSPSRDLVAVKPATALTVPSVSTRELASRDMVGFVNLPAVRAKFQPMLQQGRGQALTEIERGLAGAPQMTRFAPFIKAVINQVFNLGDRFLTEAQGASVGLSLVPEGINATVLAEFQPGTYFAQTVSGIKNTDAPLVGGLPAGKYLSYGGWVSDPVATTKFVTEMFEPAVKELLAVGPEMSPAQDYFDAIKAQAAASRGGNFGMLAPSGAIGAEPLVQVVSVQTGDPKAMIAANTKAVDAQQRLMKGLNIPGGDAMKPTYTPNAKVVDGVSFDSVVTKVDMNAQNPAVMQQAQMMAMIYGPQGAVMLFGAIGEKLLITTGLNDATVSKAIAAAKTDAAPLAATDGIKAVAAQLPKQRAGVVYVDVGNIVTTTLGYARQFGFAIPVQLPPELPPIGASVGTDQTAFRMDVHVPTMLIQSLIAASMQAQMQMQGGGRPPGGGL